MKTSRKPVSTLASVTNFYLGSHKRNGQLLAESPMLGMEFTHLHQEKKRYSFYSSTRWPSIQNHCCRTFCSSFSQAVVKTIFWLRGYHHAISICIKWKWGQQGLFPIVYDLILKTFRGRIEGMIMVSKKYIPVFF